MVWMEMEAQEGHQPAGATKAIPTNALMEKLHLKYEQKPWAETLKLVHFCMDKPLQRPVGNPMDGPLLACMEKIQRTLNAKSLFYVMNRLESLSKQKGLNSHVSPSGTACYITSDMFYIEVQLEKDGKVMDVKLAHLGEAPVICDELVQHLRMKDYNAFGKILEDLSNIYRIPGNSEMKAKGYLALQALEKDLYLMSLQDRTEDVSRVTEVLHGKVGHLVPRSGGTPLNIEFYISPYQVLETELNPGKTGKAEIIKYHNNFSTPHVSLSKRSLTRLRNTSDSQVCGAKIVVTVEGTDTLHRLPISPLIADFLTGEDGSPAFLPLTDELSMDLSACFLLKSHQPIPMSSSSIEEIQRLTGIQIADLKLAPLYELIVQSTLKEKCSEDLSTHNSCFFVSLPDCPKHCYFINEGSEKSALTGALVSKIPFTHPKCVPGIIEVLRHQMAYNTLISSCVSEKHINEDDSELLYFEVTPQKNTSVSVSFPHPMKDNLACVVINVITSREIQCSLYLHPQDPTLNSSDDFISRAVKRCMSIPVVMRAIFRNATKGVARSKPEDKEVDTEQRPASPCEPIPGPNGLQETLSGAGQQDLVVREKPSAQGGTDERLSAADLDTVGDSTDKSTPRVNTQTPCNALQGNYSAHREADMADAK